LRLVPERYEFWRNRDDRLHERRLFLPRPGGGWDVTLLQP
jgi:pyridoxine/pyridoxamine 5'-phosphate oxidase